MERNKQGIGETLMSPSSLAQIPTPKDYDHMGAEKSVGSNPKIRKFPSPIRPRRLSTEDRITNIPVKLGTSIHKTSERKDVDRKDRISMDAGADGLGGNDHLVGIRREAAKTANEDAMVDHQATGHSEWIRLRNFQLAALRLARKKRETEAEAGTKTVVEVEPKRAMYTLFAAKAVAKRIHEKSRAKNAQKWEALIKRAREEKQHIHQYPQVVKLMEAGVPPQSKGMVWKAFLGVEKQRAKHPENYYRTLSRNADYYINKYEESDKKNVLDFYLQIKKDIPRTLPEVSKLHTKEGERSLLRMLMCYYYRNPQAVGYCQGMNLVGGGLLSVMDEEDAFWSLVCVIESRIGYYTKSMAGLLVDQHVLDTLFSYHFPELYDHLKNLEVSVASFTTSWFICLFMETPVPYKVCLQLWDYLFCYGDEMLFQVALAVLRKKRNEMMKIDDSGVLLMFTLKLGSDLEQWILSEVSSKIGELITAIGTLRRSYTIRVMDDHRKIKNNAKLDKLRRRYRIKTNQEVQELWQTFISPNPWQILVQNCMPSMVWFSDAIRKACYQEESANWRDNGLLSGFMLQLFHILDVHGTGQISFENFIWLCRILQHGSDRERSKLVFKFFDANGDRKVDKTDLLAGFKRIARMYGGRVLNMRKKLYMMVNSFLFWFSYLKRKQQAKVADDIDVKVSMASRPFGFSIAELRIGRNTFLEVSGVDGHHTLQGGVEPGWKIISVAGKSTIDVDVPTLVGYCKEAELPCEVVFQKPGNHQITAEEFISCIDAFIHLEPRIKTLFFGNMKTEEEQKESAKPPTRVRSKSSGTKAEGIVQWLRQGLGRKDLAEGTK